MHWTARHVKALIFIICALLIYGVYVAFSIPISVFPATNFPRIVIGVDNGVMPIDQMQVMVTRPIEEAVNTVPGLDHVTSITSRGSAEVDVFFQWNVDMFQTLQSVNAALARAQNMLPSTAIVTANRMTFAAFPIMGYSLTSTTVPQTKLWEMATYTLKPRLNHVAGVSTVVVQGGEEPEFAIEPDAEKLVEAQVSVPMLLDAVAKSNLIDSPGLIEKNHQLVLALVSGQAKTAQEVGQIVARTTASGQPVRIADVAAVKRSVKPVYTIVTANGKPAVLLNIFRQPDSNTVAVANEVHSTIDELRQELPAGTKIEAFYDQSDLVKASIASVRDAIVIGLVLAAAILVLFLRDWGSSLVAGLVIPATIAVTFIALRLMGESFNLMTLGGLAAAVGLIIDDAIVVVENIVVQRGRGGTISEALAEIRVPLVGSTVTPIVVFIPLMAISGVTGVFFRALAVTVGAALLTSLALALTWTPALSSLLLKRAVRHEEKQSAFAGIYQRSIQFSLAHPAILGALCVLLIGVSWLCYSQLGSDLLPEMDEGGFVLDYLTPAGASLKDTNEILVGVEKILREVPEVESTSRRTGLQLGFATVTEANRGDFLVKLKRERKRSVDEVVAEVREKVNKQFPNLDTDFPQILQDQIGDLTGAPDPIQIKLFSENTELLQEWAPKVADAIKTISSVKDVKNGIEDTISGPAITFSLDQGVAARAGFTPQEAELDASALIGGEPATVPVIQNGRAYTLRVRFPESTRFSLDTIRNTLLVSGSGRIATLGTLAAMENNPGQIEIRRENLQRDVTVTGRFEDMSLGTGMKLVRAKVDSLHVPAAVRIVYGGLFQEQQKSFRDLLFVLLAAVVLVFIVLLVEFGDFTSPIAILASALLSTSGVFVALLATGTTFNISSFMGLIMVIGIVAKNGILLLDANQKFRIEGMSAREAVVEAGARRLRPILMTALATIAGMIPLSLAIGEGSQMLQPLAIAVIGGEPATVPVIQNGRAYTLRVRFPESTRFSLDTIRNTLLVSGSGRIATLGTLAAMENNPGQIEIRRENLQRDVTITGRFEDMSLGTGMKLVRAKVDSLHVPAAVRIVYGGLFQEQQKSFRDLLFVLLAAVVLVFIVLLVEFGDFTSPIAILASALLSTSGVFVALLATGTTFNISSFMGLIMVIGIVAKNGILLLDANQKFRHEGMSAREAVVEAGARRLRPILMTALATIAGMIPLSLAIGEGSQMLQPLAIAVIGGIVASLGLSLIVTPSIHFLMSNKDENRV